MVRIGHSITRRTVLRGAGAVVALPLVEEMIGKRALAAGDVPRRVISVAQGGGLMRIWQDDYFAGPMAPLAPFSKKLGYLRGLEGKKNHGPANAFSMTGVTWVKDSGLVHGPTLDYTLMKHFYPGGFPGAIPFLSTGVYNNQEHPNVFHRVWNDSPQPASLGAPVTDPRELFRTLFGRYPGATSDATTSESFAARRRSILDGVMAQFRELTGDASSL
ncbi:MAG: DUF1552 domain-containing protein, partial [Myxococcota bacterium]